MELGQSMVALWEDQLAILPNTYIELQNSTIVLFHSKTKKKTILKIPSILKKPLQLFAENPINIENKVKFNPIKQIIKFNWK